MRKMKHIRKFGEVFEHSFYEGTPIFGTDQFDEFCEYVSTWEENNEPVFWDLYFPVGAEDSYRTKAHAEEVWENFITKGKEFIVVDDVDNGRLLGALTTDNAKPSKSNISMVFDHMNRKVNVSDFLVAYQKVAR